MLLSDQADIAQDREAAFLQDRLAAQQRDAALDAPGRADCADCQEEIPADRRAALPSAIRCVSCQAWFERARRT